jgi:hypothetical protein
MPPQTGPETLIDTAAPSGRPAQREVHQQGRTGEGKNGGPAPPPAVSAARASAKFIKGKPMTEKTAQTETRLADQNP